MPRILQRSLSIIVFLAAWEVISRTGVVPITLFPPPTQVVSAFIEWVKTGEFIQDAQVSLWRAIVGFGLGSIIGILVGLATGRIALVDSYLSPLIQILRPLPPVAIIPLVIVWFGIGEASKLFSIAFAVFFPVWINTHAGAKDIPQTFLWSAKTLKVQGLDILWKVIFPAALPFVVAGLRTGISIAFVMVFVSELAGASSGIGYQISISNLAYRVDRMVAALIFLGVCGAVADIFVTRLMWLVFPWLRLSRK